jgi:hypothetical protein
VKDQVRRWQRAERRESVGRPEVDRAVFVAISGRVAGLQVGTDNPPIVRAGAFREALADEPVAPGDQNRRH